MKKVLFIACAMVFTAFSQEANAQFTPSIGLDIAIPLGDFGDFVTMGVGATAAGEYAVGDKIGVVANVGYISLFVDSDLKDFIKSASLMPLQAGVRYYIVDNTEGFYALGNIGTTIMAVTPEEGDSDSESYLSFGFGAGMLVGDALDISAIFNVITADSDVEDAEASNYIGLRAAFRFGN